MDGFEDPGSAWHQFSHSLGKFVQILFLSERNHWIGDPEEMKPMFMIH